MPRFGKRAALVALLTAPVTGCAASGPADDSNPAAGGSGGRAGSSGTSAGGSGGGTGSGGSAGVSSSDAAGGAGPGGAGGAAGTGGDGGTSGSGAGGEAGMDGSASGGTSAGGSAGATGGQGGTGGEPAHPSAGCGKQGRPAGGTVTVANDHIYTFPEGYDGTKPFPLFLGFHACGNPIDQFLNLTRGSRFETEYVRAFPRSSDSGGCWNYGSDIARVTRVYDELLSSYCIDTERVFAAGHSSGAQMIVQIQTHASDAAHVRFKAVAPVAASDYGALSGPMPVLYIHGKNDTVRRNDGAGTVARFRTANGCGTSSTPYSEVMGCQSSGRTVNPGCIAYEGCRAPTIWCSHDDPQYSGTSHGVPCFAVRAMADFFEAQQ